MKKIACLLLLFTACLCTQAQNFTRTAPQGFPLATTAAAASIYVDAGDDWLVQKAALLLQRDIKDSRESFFLQTLSSPMAGVAQALVITGSDKRGTAYGVFELSKQLGVSPWYRWGDVPVAGKPVVYVKKDRYKYGSPSVRYRGIFILEYDFTTDRSGSGGSGTISLYFSPTLNFKNDEGLTFAVSIDDETPQVFRLNKEDADVQVWNGWVANNCIIKKSIHKLAPGREHTLKYWMVSPAVALQKTAVDFENFKPYYLGPPETKQR